MSGNLSLLTDDQMRQFITEGYLILKTDFSQAFHRHLYEQLDQVYQKEGNPGNNLLPRIPELQKVFDHPIISGALTSVLGSDYMLHAHRHGHYNNNPNPGGWHKDSYWGYLRPRNIHPWWAMIMYFPQDTPIELGPTSVMPGTHFYESKTFENDMNEAKANGEAGTFALIHYDIWHQSTANTLGLNRYMLKFEFMRTQAPKKPSWNNSQPEWITPASFSAPIHPHQVIWQETWNWLSGSLASAAQVTMRTDRPARQSESIPVGALTDKNHVAKLIEGLNAGNLDDRAGAADQLGVLGMAAAMNGAIPALALALEDPYEPIQLNAAYGLAGMGKQGIDALLSALRNEDLQISRSAGYGLSVAGSQAVKGLKDVLDGGDGTEHTILHAVFALGELRGLALEAVPRLISLLDHPSVQVRSAVVETLSNIQEPRTEITNALVKGLQDLDPQVRFMSGLAVIKMGKLAVAAVPHLIAALEDRNRYVRAHAAEALYYIGTPEAKDALISFLRTSRWCSSTTPDSTFYP